MKFIETEYAWKADDAFGMYFSKRDYPEPPTEFPAWIIGHVCLVKPAKHTIKAAYLHLFRTVKCGVRKRIPPPSDEGWSSNVEFGLYEYRHMLTEDPGEDRVLSRGLVIAMKKGGGDEFFHVDQLEALATFEAAAGLNVQGTSLLGESELWDLCYMIVGSYRKGYGDGKDEATQTYQRAFVDGRLKKRKLPSKGTHKVWIEEPKPQEV